MSVFEFLLILVSIIAGLGIAELLGGVVRILRGQLRATPLHSTWILIVFLQQVQHVWGKWDIGLKSEWLFPELVLFLLPSILLYLIAALLFPAPGQECDLDSYLLSRRLPIFGMIALLMFVFAMEGWIVFDDQLGGPEDRVRLLQIVNLLVLTVTQRRWVHWTVAALVLSVMIGFILLFTLGVAEGS